MGGAEFNAGDNHVIDWHLIHAMETGICSDRWQYEPLGLMWTNYFAIRLSF